MPKVGISRHRIRDIQGRPESSRSLVLAAGENFPFVADEKVTARRPRTGRGG